MAENTTMGNSRESKRYILAPVVTTDLRMSTPTPPLSPTASMSPLVRPPTQGGGPLSSHPTTPIDMPGAWISTSDLVAQAEKPPSPSSSASRSLSAGVQPLRHDSFRTPQIPASANRQRRPSSGVRKLLSLSSLRNSLLGSRNSVSDLSPASRSTSSHQVASHEDRPSSRVSSAGQGIKRSASPSVPSAAVDGSQHAPSPLRKKKSASWFKRKSQIFLFSQDDTLDSLVEAQSRPGTNMTEKADQNNSQAQPHQTQGGLQASQTQGTPRSRQSSYGFSLPRPVSQAFGVPRSRQSSYTVESPKSRQSSYAYEPPKSRQASQAQERPRSQQVSQAHEDPQSPSASQDYESSEANRVQLVRPASPPPRLELPQLGTLREGGMDGGSFGEEDMFANIGR